MALKSELESKETECTSFEDYVALAQEALADPADQEYARHLLDQAETSAQMPADYVMVAEAAAKLGDNEFVAGIYQQAEDMCFEALEFAAVGHSLATHTDNKEKARELLERAAEEANEPEAFLQISGYAKTDLDNAELADQLLSKVDEKAKSLDDYRKLAHKLIDSGEKEMARTFFKKAERYCSGIEESIAYAADVKEIFDDTQWAISILDDNETSCQFPKDFTLLAEGYKTLTGSTERIEPLMQQAADFAMTGEEQLDLGNGYWELLQDKEAATTAYEKALPDLNDKTQLLDLAARIGADIGNSELAKKIFAKVEEKSSGAGELKKLAQTVHESLQDKTYAAEIYLRAAEGMNQPNDLMAIADDLVVQLEDKDKATDIYRNAFGVMESYGQYIKLAEQVNDKLGDKAFAQEILTRAVDTASGAPELVSAGGTIMAILEDNEMARPVLERAEEQVTSVGELEDVISAVEAHFPKDTEWLKLTKEKLELRKANQEKYAAFQQREEKADTFIRLIQLSDDVMQDLQDPFYARKLLTLAEKMMADQGFNFNQAGTLVEAVNSHLQDRDWCLKLLNKMAEECTRIDEIRDTARSATRNLGDGGAEQAKTYLKDWEQRISERDDVNGYDYTKLAGAVLEDLGDTKYAKVLLQAAGKLGGDRFFLAHMGELCIRVGEDSPAEACFRKAAESCKTPQQAAQLINRFTAIGVKPDLIKELYTGLKERMQAPHQRLAWAEGIIELFADKQWAASEFSELKSKAASEGERKLIESRRKLRFAHRLR